MFSFSGEEREISALLGLLERATFIHIVRMCILWDSCDKVRRSYRTVVIKYDDPLGQLLSNMAILWCSCDKVLRSYEVVIIKYGDRKIFNGLMTLLQIMNKLSVFSL
jgi:hypothetical protein